MGPIEKDLRRWCKRPLKRLNHDAAQFYMEAAHSCSVWMGSPPDDYEDVMSEAIEAAEALGL